jgi:hypothetical protein
MISTKPARENPQFSICENLDRDSNLTKESDQQDEKHLSPKTSTDEGTEIRPNQRESIPSLFKWNRKDNQGSLFIGNERIEMDDSEIIVSAGTDWPRLCLCFEFNNIGQSTCAKGMDRKSRERMKCDAEISKGSQNWRLDI